MKRIRHFWLVAWMAAAAYGAPADESPIVLPDYLVVERRELPAPESWRYARVEGFEVLSSAPDNETRDIVRSLQEFRLVLDLVWPTPAWSMPPTSLIICGRNAAFERFRLAGDRNPSGTSATLVLRNPEHASIVVDAEANVVTLAIPEIPDLGDDVVQHEINAPEQLKRAYMHLALGDADPPLAPWLIEGLSQLSMRIKITPTSITVGKLEDPNTGMSLVGDGLSFRLIRTDPSVPEWDRDFNGALRASRLIPMAEMLAMPADSMAARNPIATVWAKQCYAFVHWGLYGDRRNHQKAFASFCARLAHEPVTEAMFKECFHFGFKEAGIVLRSYIQSTDYTSIELQAKKGERLPVPPEIKLREATEAESGRITGDALALAGKATAARRALLVPYLRGERDPKLLAALGLQERAGGDDGKARPLLEAAVKAGVTRPRAYVELARLRATEVFAQPKGTGGRIDVEQLGYVLGPLYTARKTPPALAETYEVIADTWLRSGLQPDRPFLDVLDEGVRQFPRDTPLLCEFATLLMRTNAPTQAAAVVELGLRFAPDEIARKSLLAILPTLPAGAKPPLR